MTPQTLAKVARAQNAADRIGSMRAARATALAERAGVGAMRNVWHNAMSSRDNGTPWVGVDYSLLRQAIRIDSQRSAYRIASDLFNRLMREASN